jgi:hypothetical protein
MNFFFPDAITTVDSWRIRAISPHWGIPPIEAMMFGRRLVRRSRCCRHWWYRHWGNSSAVDVTSGMNLNETPSSFITKDVLKESTIFP